MTDDFNAYRQKLDGIARKGRVSTAARAREEPDLSDQGHCAAVNGLIAVLNGLMEMGYPSDFVASAAVAAAGMFSAFNLSGGGAKAVSDDDIARVVGQFEVRIREGLLTLRGHA